MCVSVKLLYTLTWDPVTERIGEYHAKFYDSACVRLGSALGAVRPVSPDTFQDLLSALRRLPEASALRVASAPHTAYLCTTQLAPQASLELSEFLADAFEAEARVLDNSSRFTRGLWTALGDRFFPAGTVESVNAFDGQKHRPRPDSEIVAPVADGIPVDFDSPLSRSDIAIGFPRHIRIANKERDRIAHDLSAALLAIRASSPVAYRLVQALTKVVVPIKLDDTRLGSFSSRWYPGRTVLINPQTDAATQAHLVSALIHEAIHSLLWVSEIDSQLVRTPAEMSPVVSSAWTGRVLPLVNYLEACFVWYGLYHFWLLARRAGTFQRYVIDARLTTAAAGFQNGDLVAALGEHVSFVNPLCVEMIRRMQDVVLRVG